MQLRRKLTHKITTRNYVKHVATLQCKHCNQITHIPHFYFPQNLPEA